MMKSKIIYLINKLFSVLESFALANISSPEEFKEKIKNLPIVKQERKLIKLSEYIVKKGDLEFYNKLLKVFIPALDMNLSKSKFLKTDGLGTSSLSSFRKIEDNDNILFEKVYFTSHNDLKRIVWLQENLFDLIKPKINIPEIYKTCQGQILTVVYYEYLKLDTIIDDRNKLDQMLKLSKVLYSLTAENLTYLESISLPEYITDVFEHPLIKSCFEKAKGRAIRQNLNFTKYASLLNQSKKIIAHGDIYESNVYLDNTLIDWDSFGYFPIGFDAAYMFQRYLWKEKKIEDFQQWLPQNYYDFIKSEDWKDFERNSYFFLYIFCAFLFESGKYPELESDLIKQLNNN